MQEVFGNNWTDYENVTEEETGSESDKDMYYLDLDTLDMHTQNMSCK